MFIRRVNIERPRGPVEQGGASKALPVFGDNLALPSAAVGFLKPILIAAVNPARWPFAARGLMAFALCLVAAAVLVYVWAT